MDTTVILAQPRGSRLRADAVYVHASGSVRAPFGLRSGSVRASRMPGYGRRWRPRASLKIGYVSRNLVPQNPLEMRWVGSPNVGHVSLTAEKQPFPSKSGVHIASVMVTKMDFSIYENLSFFWILMPQGSELPSFFKKGVHI